MTHGLAAAAHGLLKLSEPGGELPHGADEAEIAQLNEALRQRQQIGLATGRQAQRFAITPERARWLAADNADDENTGAANPDRESSRTSYDRSVSGMTC